MAFKAEMFRLLIIRDEENRKKSILQTDVPRRASYASQACCFLLNGDTVCRLKVVICKRTLYASGEVSP